MASRAISGKAGWLPTDLHGWRGHLALLGGSWTAILLVFVRDVFGMASIWWNASTFGHCLFIPFLIGWLVWQRKDELAQLDPVAWWPGLVWLAGGAACWLVGDAASVALFRHTGVIVMLQGAVLGALGPVVSRGIAFPIFYALFMVPFGEEIVPQLQLLTAKLAMAMLGWMGVPAHIEGIFITTPNGYFKVAEACSGAKFLIAMAAYGALVANVCFKRWERRIAFLIGALVLSVLANGVRAFATIYVAYLTTADAAAGFDHVVYGWVFFGLIILAVMGAGWPFFDRKPNERWFDPARLRGRAVPAAPVLPVTAAGLALIAAAPLWGLVMRSGGEPIPSSFSAPQVPGWVLTNARPAYPWRPRFDGADRVVNLRYVDAQGQMVDMSIAAYERQSEGKELVGFGQGAVDPDSKWAWSNPATDMNGGHGEEITAPGPVVRHVVSFYIVGSIETGSAAKVKLETLKVRLRSEEHTSELQSH